MRKTVDLPKLPTYPATADLVRVIDISAGELDGTPGKEVQMTVEDFFTDVYTDPLWANDLTLGVESVPRMLAQDATIATTSGTLRLAYFTARKATVAANAKIVAGGTAAAATPTLVRIGLYTVASDGDLTLVASTANDTALLATQNTLYTKTLGDDAYTFTIGQRYAAGVLVVTGATAPTLVGCNAGAAVTGLVALEPYIAANLTSQTDLPASIDVGDLTVSGAAPWIAFTESEA